jgi:hypothetical protein
LMLPRRGLAGLPSEILSQVLQQASWRDIFRLILVGNSPLAHLLLQPGSVRGLDMQWLGVSFSRPTLVPLLLYRFQHLSWLRLSWKTSLLQGLNISKLPQSLTKLELDGNCPTKFKRLFCSLSGFNLQLFLPNLVELRLGSILTPPHSEWLATAPPTLLILKALVLTIPSPFRRP